MNEYPEFMIDLETLGTGMDAHILAIGACSLWDTEDNFYCEMLTEEQNRKIDPATIQWWMEQSEEARRIFKDYEDSIPLHEALFELLKWMRTKGNTHKAKIWSHGATFDVPIVQHALMQYGIAVPWRFWNVRDTRTLIDLIKQINNNDPMKPIREGTHHNALDDAIYQAEWMQNILRVLIGEDNG